MYELLTINLRSTAMNFTAKLRDLYERLVTNGFEGSFDHDTLRKLKTVNTFAVVLVATSFLFACLDFLVFNKPYIAGVEFLAFLSGLYFLFIQRRLTNIKIIANIAVAIVVGAFLCLNLMTGVGSSNTFWFYMIPPFAFYVSGVRSGFLWSGITYTYLILLLLLGVMGIFGAEVGVEYANDIITSYGIIILLAFFFEYARANALKDLSSTNDEMRRLIYAVSHDLRTPLTGLRGYADFLKEDISSNNTTEIKTDIDRIEMMAANMGKMIDDLLNLSRIGRKTEDRQVVNTKEVIDLIFIENESVLQKRKIRVQIVEPLPRLYLHKRKFEEVTRNLISNAIKYMGESKDPLIKFGVEDYPGEYHFYVQDHGIGIDRKDFGKLFNLFSRLTSIAEGSGIGLSIVKGFVNDMGGQVWIDSEVGKGSTFWFSIPKVSPPTGEVSVPALPSETAQVSESDIAEGE